MEPIEENHVTEDHDNDHMTDYGEQSMSGEYIRWATGQLVKM